jgi:hypothetical protein
MIAEGISESDSEKPRRGRPRSVVREVADDMDRMLRISGCQRTKVNEAYRLRATGRAFDLPDDEQRVLFGSTKSEIWSGKGPGKFPPGWQTAAEEIGRFLVSIAADDDTAADYLRVVVKARRDGISWRGIRSHFRSLRLGERQGNAIALWIELSRTIDAYRSRFPATTDQMIVGAVESLLEVVSEQTDPDTGSPAGNDLTICVP